ncbi:hypothetical protein ACMCNP_04665 [Candidatus Acidulodesulfobacterium sp. H_13]|uniref:hypothetical protein n=1 Tax=Candidatus Acidulodesulfobacterium sp. H_13 TaxID=3395470 RepID=UPI003AF79661
MMQIITNYTIEVKVNSQFVRKNEIEKLVGSNEKLFGLIGYVTQKDFSETLKEMYKGDI